MADSTEGAKDLSGAAVSSIGIAKIFETLSDVRQMRTTKQSFLRSRSSLRKQRPSEMRKNEFARLCVTSVESHMPLRNNFLSPPKRQGEC